MKNSPTTSKRRAFMILAVLLSLLAYERIDVARCSRAKAKSMIEAMLEQNRGFTFETSLNATSVSRHSRTLRVRYTIRANKLGASIPSAYIQAYSATYFPLKGNRWSGGTLGYSKLTNVVDRTFGKGERLNGEVDLQISSSLGTAHDPSAACLGFQLVILDSKSRVLEVANAAPAFVKIKD